MKSLKEAINLKHREAERMPFNIAMLEGKLTPAQYTEYLFTQLEIFSTIEEVIKLPHDGLRRKEAILQDLKAMGVEQFRFPVPASLSYTRYLREVDQETGLAHVYLNYLALMFGGQIMIDRTPGPGHMYKFENMNDLIKEIRAVQKDEWADEVNRGFTYIIKIFKELERCLTTD